MYSFNIKGNLNGDIYIYFCASFLKNFEVVKCLFLFLVFKTNLRLVLLF